ncbi:MAG: cyclodeaminase/cyclohydrolase family protein, partial [Planctomycetes bacterium]|nr:cyclodeaminase/cyclohydrolase family protein [Planctomycetota bacterium]
GSASAYAGAMGTALVAMVARSTVSRKKFSGVKEMMWAIIDQAEALRASLTVLGDQDAAAYLALVSATRLPKDTTEQQAIRKNNILQATIGASLIPLQVSRIAVILLDLAYQAAAYGNPNAIADAATAGILAKACMEGSILNARHNLASVKEGDIVQPMLAELAILEQQAKESELKLRSVLMEKTNLVF